MHGLFSVLVFSVLCLSLCRGDVTPVLDGAMINLNNTLQIEGGEGQTLVVTCTSDLSTVYLEYNSTIYNDSVLINGSYSVNFTILATREDDGKNVTCTSVNSTSQEAFETWALVYLKLKPIDVFIGGVATYEDGDIITLSCNSIGSRPAATFPVILENFSIVNLSEVQTVSSYDALTDTYNTTSSFTRVADSAYNGKTIVCFVSVDTVYNRYIPTNNFSRVIVNYGPSDIQVALLGDETGNEGSVITFKCRSGYLNPAPTFQWFNNSDPAILTTQPVITEHQSGGFYYDGYQEWPIVLNRNQIGSEIKCVVMGTGNRSVAVNKTITNVYYKPVIEVTGAPLIDMETGYYIYDEGDSVNLTCNLLEANPATSVSWLVQASSGGSPTISNESLMKTDLKRWHENDRYSCDATNRVDTATVSVRLRVQYGPDIWNNYPRYFVEGDNVTVTCEVNSNPPAKVWWQRKGDNSIFVDGTILSMTNVTRENGGDYLCVATSNRTRANGTVEAFTTNETFSIQVQYGPGNSIRLSPNITTIETTHGSPFPVVECIADCNPPCSYFWTTMGSGANLSLGTVNKWHHTGEHTCVASNMYDGTRYETNITFVMYVRYQSYIESVDLDNYNWYEEGAPVKTTCIVKGYPQPNVTWSRNNGTEIPSGTFTVDTSVNCQYDCRMNSTLTVHSAECLESGSRYTCAADNGITGPITRHSLNRMWVKCDPRPADSDVYNYSLSLGDTVNLTAVFIAIPGPAVQWLFRPTPNSGNVSLEIDDSDRRWENIYFTAVYTLVSIETYDFGQYLAVADNFNGIQSTIIFNVMQNTTGFPHKPHSLAVTCTKSSAAITWISPYNGGYSQNFTVLSGWRSPPTLWRPSDIMDPGENMSVSFTMMTLEMDNTYYFSVAAVNQKGTTKADEIVSCRTVDGGSSTNPSEQVSSSGGVIAGAVIGSLALVAVLAVIGFFLFRRYQSQQGRAMFDGFSLDAMKKS